MPSTGAGTSVLRPSNRRGPDATGVALGCLGVVTVDGQRHSLAVRHDLERVLAGRVSVRALAAEMIGVSRGAVPRAIAELREREA